VIYQKNTALCSKKNAWLGYVTDIPTKHFLQALNLYIFKITNSVLRLMACSSSEHGTPLEQPFNSLVSPYPLYVTLAGSVFDLAITYAAHDLALASDKTMLSISFPLESQKDIKEMTIVGLLTITATILSNSTAAKAVTLADLDSK
jgi:hypothetical protein